MSEGQSRPVAAPRGPAICEHCGKPGEREPDRINPDGWFFLAAKFDPEDKPKRTADDRLIIHACSVECRDAMLLEEWRLEAIATVERLNKEIETLTEAKNRLQNTQIDGRALGSLVDAKTGRMRRRG